MDLEKNNALPVTDPSDKPEKLQNDSAMTRKGAYAAISYMASAGLFLSVYLLFLSFSTVGYVLFG